MRIGSPSCAITTTRSSSSRRSDLTTRCNAIKAGCYCWLVADHDDDAHLCGCGGSWLPNGREIRNPGPFGVLDVMPEPEPLPLRVRRGLIEFLRPPTLGAPS